MFSRCILLLALMLLSWSCSNKDKGSAVALNNLADSVFQVASCVMDYEEAKRLYKESEVASRNEIERLISDVGRMKIAQRLSQNKDFYYARNSALNRLRRINEGEDIYDLRFTIYDLNESKETRDKDEELYGRVIYAESEFYMTAAIYHKGKGQDNEKMSAINSIGSDYVLRYDTVQWLKYELITGSGGMYEAPSEKEVTLGEFGKLVNVILIGHSKGYVNLEAYGLLALAEITSDEYKMETIDIERDGVLEIILREEGMSLIGRAGTRPAPTDASNINVGQTRAQASGEESRATTRVAPTGDEISDLRFALAERALELFVEFGDQYGMARAEYFLGRLCNMSGDAEGAIVYFREALDIVADCVPELEMEIREQLSVAYSAMDMKDESDYNRSVYIDLLEYTRQDREDDLRAADLESESRQLDIMIIAAGVCSVMLICFIVIMSERWRKRNEAYLSGLKKELQEKRDKTSEELENGSGITALEEERMRLEKELYVHSQHLTENKCQNMVKKACLSIVAGIVPYIDRMANEISKLQTENYARQEDVKREKLAYISELAGKINEYNEILSLWIKMKQGSINLNIESFRLNELLEIVAKGRRSFEMKGLSLEVAECDAVVKADKALTLFMINTLSENARKYTPEGGAVKIYAKEEDSFVEVSIEDNGPGLSGEDIDKILNEKVYDSGQIGMETSSDRQALRQKKGHGFGLMNCKGIIEKYRKTSPVFGVCCFKIESAVGKGSRFYFRLPRREKREERGDKNERAQTSGEELRAQTSGAPTAVLLALMMIPLGAWGQEYVETRQDTLLLERANEYANIVYECNLDSAYEEALVYADSAIIYLNEHFTSVTDLSEPLLQLYDSDGYAAEEEWIGMKFNSDYNILIYLRNEVAVAALALKDFALYDYNNSLYSYVYRYVTSYNRLEEYCQNMELASGRKVMAICILGLMVLICATVWYVVYYRHRLLYRYNVEQLFYIYKSILETASEGSDDVEERLANSLYSEINELIPLSGLALAVYDEETKRMHCCFSGKVDDIEVVRDGVELSFGKQESSWSKVSGEWSYIPLWVNIGERRCVGVLGVVIAQANPLEEDLELVEMASSYLALVLYHTVVRMRRKFSDIELAQDEARRTVHEENMLHVQNMVLDNCLSTIKHETVYYPNRIKQIAESLRAGTRERREKREERRESRAQASGAPTGDEKIRAMADLVGYYKDVFTILSRCASRQLEEVTFRRSTVDVKEVISAVEKYFKRCSKKSNVIVELDVEAETGLKVSGDKVLIEFLFRNLIDDALRLARSGKIMLKARQDGGFVRFDFIDSRRSLPKEQLDLLFSPDAGHIKVDESDLLTGAEYLVCKQIVREHDEFCGRRGCRINAELSSEGGVDVWFTLRKG